LVGSSSGLVGEKAGVTLLRSQIFELGKEGRGDLGERADF